MAEFKDTIYYLCDRKACKNCSEQCKHTSDIAHAINFNRTGIFFDGASVGYLYIENDERTASNDTARSD